MRTAIVVCVALAACGKKTESGSGEARASGSELKPAADRFAKVKQPKVSPVCEKARMQFGYGAECIETELPELTSPAGKLTRVAHKGDPTARWIYVLTKPDGSMFVGDGGPNGTILDEVLKGFDAKTAAPELLAKLDAALSTEVSLVRCLPGTNDSVNKAVACKPPAFIQDGDTLLLTYLNERFAHPRLNNRNDHWLFAQRVAVSEHKMSASRGEGLFALPDAPLPKQLPPLPTMTSPPAWVAKPVEASADVSSALCMAAADKVGGMTARTTCKAYAYPSLDIPAGALFYLANDAGLRHVLALKKTDGKIVTGYDFDASENPMIDVVKNYDPKTMPAAKLVALYLFLHGEAAHILCLPGSNDVIPDNKCEPPKAEKKGEELVLTYIVEELPFPDNHGTVDDPAVRSYSTELTPGGGSSGGGFRLVDMREN